MVKIERQIEEIVHRETRARDTQDAELLMTIFHPDMVCPWPRTTQSHDPIDWVLELGRYDYDRWKKGFEDLFRTHRLNHNMREMIKIEVSKEGDGAFAVVDIDTLWVDDVDVRRAKNHWLGRVSKVYTKMANEWKLIMHTGVLDYSFHYS